MAKTNPFDGAQEIQQLLVAYAKQETVEPFKHLGRYLGFGLGGSLLVFLGAFFVGLGALRLSQTFDVFDGGSWASTLPYVIAIAVLVLALISIYVALDRAKKKLQ